MIALNRFLGEVPKSHPRLLPDGFAQAAVNCKVERGILEPFHRPDLTTTLGTDAVTTYRHQGTWLSWNAAVDVVPGPVRQDRLYITGDGVPKVRMENGATYPLALPAPAAKPAVSLRKMNEYITVDGKEVALRPGRTGKSSNYGVTIKVNIRYNTASIIVTHPTGLTEGQMASLVNGIRYRATASGGATSLVTGQRVVRILRLRDNGGQDYDVNRNPIGSDTRMFEELGTAFNIDGASSVAIPDFVFGTLGSQDATDVAGQNDPPTLTTNTSTSQNYASGDAPLGLFGSTEVSTIESGQTLILLEFSVENLTNGTTDPAAQEVVRYVYTYVTSFGEESGPSPLSAMMSWSPGQTIRVDDFAAPPAGRAIDRIRIYRLETSATGVTDLFFVDERPSSSTFFDDAIDYIPSAEPIGTMNYTPPQDDLKGIISLPNGMMAAFDKRDLYFCEPWRPHAWPASYMLTMDAEIVGLAAFGSTLAVLTKRQPYIVQGTHPDNMTSEKVEVNFPCLSKRSIVDMGYFAAYASTEGLVTISNTGAQLVSQAILTDRQWRDMNIASFVCSKHQGRYVISHDDLGSPARRRCTIIDLTGQEPYLIRTTWEPNSFFFDEGIGRLYFLRGKREVYEFDPVSGPYDMMKWRSKIFVSPHFTQFGYMRCDVIPQRDSVFECRLFGDGASFAWVNARNRIEALPGGKQARYWEIEITANSEVEAIYVAQSPAEISRMAG